MIPRALKEIAIRGLETFPVVALLGPRQVGKTTLALELGAATSKDHTYLDLERDSDRNKLQEAELYLEQQKGRLTILDEIQRQPDLFPLLRSLVDERIRFGEGSGHFLVLGSASRDLLRQSSETLAGRILYLELRPFSLDEVTDKNPMSGHRLWLRGGFPMSYLAPDNRVSWDWRTSFISTYLERDIPQLGPRLPAEQMRRFWSMLAHEQGATLNAARIAGSLGVSGNTVRNYLDVLTDLYMIRQLRPWSGNSTKRLVKSPKVYVRDSGLLHRLVNIPDMETLMGHPIVGASWEGFVIENILSRLPDHWAATYYRTSAQAEIDLVLEGPGSETWAIEIKHTASPKLSKGFRFGYDEIGATRGYCVVPKTEPYFLAEKTEVVSLEAMFLRLDTLPLTGSI